MPWHSGTRAPRAPLSLLPLQRGHRMGRSRSNMGVQPPGRHIAGGHGVPHASLPAGIQHLFASCGAGAAAHHHHPRARKSCQARERQLNPLNQSGKRGWKPRQRTVRRDHSHPRRVCREGCQGGGRAEAGETPTEERPGSGKGPFLQGKVWGALRGHGQGSFTRWHLFAGGSLGGGALGRSLPQGYGDDAAPGASMVVLAGMVVLG